MGRKQSKPGYNRIMGQRLRTAIRNGNYTENQVAESLECTPDHLRKIENGTNRLTLEELLILHDEYHLDLNYLISGDDTPSFDLKMYTTSCDETEREKRLNEVLSWFLHLTDNRMR